MYVRLNNASGIVAGEKCSEDRVQLSTFHFQRYTSGGHGWPCDQWERIEKSIRRSDTERLLLSFAHPNTFFSFSLSLSVAIYSRITMFKVHSLLLLVDFSRGRSGSRCPAAEIPGGDFQRSNGLGIVFHVVRDCIERSPFPPLSSPCSRFHPSRDPIISFFSVDARMTRKGGGIEDSRGSKGFVLDRTKGANCGCIIPWTLRKISKRNRKKREKRR